MVRCLVCGRVLKDRESIRVEIGPVCLRKLKGYIPEIRNMKMPELKVKPAEVIEGQISIFDKEGENAERNKTQSLG